MRAELAHLADIAGQGDGVNVKILRRLLAVATQLQLQGAAFDLAANDFFKLGFKEVIRIGGAHGDFEIAVVERPQLNREREEIALKARLAVAGHT